MAGLGGSTYRTGGSHYGTSKHALVGLTKIMAMGFFNQPLTLSAELIKVL